MPLQRHLEHSWALSPKDAVILQRELSAHVLSEDAFLLPLRTVAGVDVGFEAGGKVTRAAVAVLSFPEACLLDEAVVRRPTAFPYVPGLLSFREAPAILDALDRLRELPDLVLVDGQGYAHPRRFGIACHLGVMTDLPTIGVGKTRLVGQFSEVPDRRGEWSSLNDEGEIVGAVLRTRQAVKPVFVSVGHRISLETAIQFVLRCCLRYRLPEAIRQAHRLASG